MERKRKLIIGILITMLGILYFLCLTIPYLIIGRIK